MAFNTNAGEENVPKVQRSIRESKCITDTAIVKKKVILAESAVFSGESFTDPLAR